MRSACPPGPHPTQQQPGEDALQHLILGLQEPFGRVQGVHLEVIRRINVGFCELLVDLDQLLIGLQQLLVGKGQLLLQTFVLGQQHVQLRQR